MIEILPIQNNTGKQGLDNAKTFVRLRAEILMREKKVDVKKLDLYSVNGESIADQYIQFFAQRDALLEEGHDFWGAFQDGVMKGAAETRPWTPKDEKSYRFPILEAYAERWIAALDSDRPKPQPIGIFALLAEATDTQTEVFEGLLDHVTSGQDETDFLLPLTKHHPALSVVTEFGFERTGRFSQPFGTSHQLYIRYGDESAPTDLAA